MYTFYEYTNTKNSFKTTLVTAFNRNGSSFCKDIVKICNSTEEGFGHLGGCIVDIRHKPEVPVREYDQEGVQVIPYHESQFFKTVRPPTYSGRPDVLIPMHIKPDFATNYVHIYRNPMHRYMSGIKQWKSLTKEFENAFGDDALYDVVHTLAKHNKIIEKHVDRLAKEDEVGPFDEDLRKFRYSQLLVDIMLKAEYNIYFAHMTDMLAMVDFVFKGGHFLGMADSHTQPISSQQAILPFIYPDMQFVEIEDLNPFMEELLDIPLHKTELHNARADIKSQDRNLPTPAHQKDFRIFQSSLPEYFSKRRQGEINTKFDDWINPELECHRALKSYANTSNKKVGLKHLEDTLTRQVLNPHFYYRCPATLAFHAYAVRLLPDTTFKKTLMDAIRNFWNNQEKEQAFDWLY